MDRAPQSRLKRSQVNSIFRRYHVLRLVRPIGFAVIAATLLFAGCQVQQPQHPAASPGALPTGPRTDVTPRLNAATYFAHGHLLERQGNYEQAATQYRKALELSPNFVSARNRLGITLNKLGRHAEATAEFRRAIEREPAQAYLHNNLGFSLYLEGRYSEAAEALARAVELDPDYRRARMNYGIVLARLGQDDQALEQFLRATDQADAHYNLGVIQADRGDFVAAARSLENALRLDPGLEAARQQLHIVSRLAAEADRTSKTTQVADELRVVSADEATDAGLEVELAENRQPAAPTAARSNLPPTPDKPQTSAETLRRVLRNRCSPFPRATPRNDRQQPRLDVPLDLSIRLRAMLSARQSGDQSQYQDLKQQVLDKLNQKGQGR
jgi:Flp pilus assembly protein TadD